MSELSCFARAAVSTAVLINFKNADNIKEVAGRAGTQKELTCFARSAIPSDSPLPNKPAGKIWELIRFAGSVALPVQGIPRHESYSRPWWIAAGGLRVSEEVCIFSRILVLGLPELFFPKV